jgi:hypothetical protein
MLNLSFPDDLYVPATNKKMITLATIEKQIPFA